MHGATMKIYKSEFITSWKNYFSFWKGSTKKNRRV